MVKLVTSDGENFDVNDDFVNMTTYFKDIQEFEGAKDEFVLNTIKKEDLSNVLRAAKIVNYKFNEVAKVNSDDARAYLGEELTALFKQLECQKLNNLFKASKELRIKGLQNNIAAYIASRVWIKLTLEDYNKKRAELGITEDLTPERSKMLKEKYPFLN